MGFLMTLMSLTLDSAAVMWYLCSSWTIRPANRLKVRGIRVAGLISISTLLAVLMNTCSSVVKFGVPRMQKWSLYLEKSGPVERRVEQHKEALGRGESGEWGRKLGKMAS